MTFRLIILAGNEAHELDALNLLVLEDLVMSSITNIEQLSAEGEDAEIVSTDDE